ncbi:hypothetical protein BpHYR1_018254 [Brachionus plicatilis]|uniref:Uncharacterized protein n=1 Tax=Brachionus plicatilis TaxID=10195 RepID=A0A3M7RVV3_BRAPC|nr:hypothetical protein BpHYR1_018254 [Brachionus plicatilis]
MVFNLIEKWSRVILVISLVVIIGEIRCYRLMESMNELGTGNLKAPIGLRRRDFSPLALSHEPLDDEFRTRLEKYFSPELIQKMTELIMTNQRIKEKQNADLVPNFSLGVDDEPRRPLPFFDPTNTDPGKNAFVEAFKQKHRRPTPKAHSQSTTTESNASILMHLYHRFG